MRSFATLAKDAIVCTMVMKENKTKKVGLGKEKNLGGRTAKTT